MGVIPVCFIKGETEGRNERPSLVVLVINRAPGDLAYVLPTSTSEPKGGDPWTIEIPRSIKNRLKLDERGTHAYTATCRTRFSKRLRH